jgi:hypothetical protein
LFFEENDFDRERERERHFRRVRNNTSNLRHTPVFSSENMKEGAI